MNTENEQVRDTSIILRVSTEEKKIISALAKFYNCSMSEYIRRLVSSNLEMFGDETQTGVNDE